jgi:hypothetical protein
MALVQEMPSPPVFADGTPYAAGLIRRLLGRMTGTFVGRFNNGDFAAMLDGSTLTVAGGRATLPAPSGETGTYLVEASASTVLSVDPADATRDRIDRVVAYVVPPATPEDQGKWYIEVLKGEPSAAPVAPAADFAYWIGDILVPKASDGVPPTLVDRRYANQQQYLAGPTTSGETRPTGALARFGAVWTDVVNRHTWVFDGASWNRLNQGVPAVTNPSSIHAPYTDQVIVDKGSGTLKRYTGAAFDDVELLKPKGKRWRTAGFHSLTANQATIPMQGSRVQGGVTTSPNGLTLPRDGIYRVWMYAYATGGANWTHQAQVNRLRNAVPDLTVCYLSFWKATGVDYTAYAENEVPLKAADILVLAGAGTDSTWGVDEASGCRLGVEYVSALPSGVSPL